MKRHDESISDRLRRMAATDELSVGRGRAEHISSRARARALTRPQTRMRTVAAAIAGSAFAVVSVTGIGALADQAVPGDSLYPIDRAYESVGRAIGRQQDRTQETLIEALALAQRGDRDRAYLHVTTELGGLNVEAPYGLEIADPVVEDPAVATMETAAVSPTTAQVSAAAAAAQSAEPAPTTTTTTTAAIAPPATESSGDPFIVAIENALRASQLAVDTPDEKSTLAATEAVRSVVKLAVGATETLSGQQAQAAPILSSTTTTQPATTTTTKPKNGANGSSTSTTSTTIVTNSSTTTTVPIDSGNTSSGTGDTAGGNSSGSQQGSGSSGGSGSGSEPTQPPIILPIP